MRILMCNSFFYRRGGADVVFLDLSELLSSHGHEVIPFCMEHERNLPSEYSRYFVSKRDFPALLNQRTSLATKLDVVERTLYSHEAKTKIEQLIQETQPDIAHIHGIGHELSPSILDAIKKSGIPIVQTVHDYGLLCPSTSFVSKGKVCERCKVHQYYQVVLRRCKRDSLSASLVACLGIYFHMLTQVWEKNTDVFIAPSHFLQQKMIEYGIDKSIIHLPNFVDVEQFQPRYEHSNYFLFYGRLVSTKGIDTLFEAMRYVKSSQLYVAGEGELKEALQEYAKQHGISNVTFLGHLDKQRLVPVIQQAAFTVFPSIWYENCPMAILESFSCGKAVIGSNIGAIPEFVNDGQSGLLFEPGNARQLAERIQFLLDNPQKAIEMGQNGRRQVETVNNPQFHYQQTIELYQRLL